MQFVTNTFLFQFFPSATLRYSCPRTCRFYELASLAHVISSFSGLRFLFSFLFSLSHSKQAMYGFIALVISLSRICKFLFTTQYSVRYSSFHFKNSFISLLPHRICVPRVRFKYTSIYTISTNYEADVIFQ